MSSTLRLLLLLCFVSSVAFQVFQPALGQPGSAGVLTVRLEGTITSMSYELVREAVEYAEETNQTVVLLINTPGGMVDATFKIVDVIEHSKVPVIGYVYPPGGKAWSAGTYILMATHLAAMAPHTLVGSCQPVSFNPLEGGSKPVENSKIVNAMTAYLVERARAHGRNEDVARRFVTENLNLNAEEALKLGVIEVVASSLPELLEKADGRTVRSMEGEVILRTRGLPVEAWTPSLRIRIFSLLSEPIVAYMLLIVGLYALIFGLASPGVGGEVIGALLLVLGLIGIGVMGANLGAAVLMIVGLVLLVAELLTPGFGIMGGTGFVCVILGGILLFPGNWTVDPSWLNLLYTIVYTVPLAVGGFFVFAAYKVVEARRRKPFIGGLIGETAEAEEDLKPELPGFVKLRGERWRARCNREVKAGQLVKVVGKDGPVLLVEPLEEKGK